jgi:hypothetical protein
VNLLDFVKHELTSRTDRTTCHRLIIDGPEDEARINADIAAGRLRGNLIIRRIVHPPVRPADYSRE